MVTISSFRVLNRVSVWAVEVDEEQSIVTFLVPPFFLQVFFHVSKFKSYRKIPKISPSMYKPLQI